MSIDLIVIYALITIFSFVLLMVTGFSYREYHNKKLLFISLVFLFLFTRGMFLSLSLFFEEFSSIVSSGYIWIFDLIVLVLLYAAYSIKR